MPREGWNVGVAASTVDSAGGGLTPRSRPVDRLGLPIGVVLDGSEAGLKTGGNLNVPSGGVLAAVCGAVGASVAGLPTLASVGDVSLVGGNDVVD